MSNVDISAVVNGNSPMPVSLPVILGEAWTTPDTNIFDARRYADVEIQVTALTGTATCQWSLDGTTFVPVDIYEGALGKTGNVIASITAPGRYRLQGNAYLKLTGQSAITVYRRAGV